MALKLTFQPQRREENRCVEAGSESGTEMSHGYLLSSSAQPHGGGMSLICIGGIRGPRRSLLRRSRVLCTCGPQARPLPPARVCSLSAGRGCTQPLDPRAGPLCPSRSHLCLLMTMLFQNLQTTTSKSPCRLPKASAALTQLQGNSTTTATDKLLLIESLFLIAGSSRARNDSSLSCDQTII